MVNLERKELLQYDISHDKTEKDVRFISEQIETHLRERFNVLLSTVEYGIVDGHLVRGGTREPFINSIKRGRDIIQIISQNVIDFNRENAEVTGFKKIDSLMSNPETPLGSKALSISLRGEKGSKYGHNFYDLFTLKERDGRRYVELLRYSSALRAQDYIERFGFYPENFLKAEDFLANPIFITDVLITPEQIHKMLHKEHKYMTISDFEEIWNGVQPAVKNYLLNRDANSFNAILNFADRVWESQKNKERGNKFIDYVAYAPTQAMLRNLGNQPVRQASGGCPGKSGADMNNAPFSVAEFSSLGKDRGYNFDHEGVCIVCHSGPKALGPCEICEECTIKIEKEEELGIAA